MVMAKRSRLLIALFLACAATTAHAQESGWYAGAAAGRSDFNSEPSSQFDHRVESDYTDMALAALAATVSAATSASKRPTPTWGATASPGIALRALSAFPSCIRTITN
jgi:hypothetical protein